MTADTMNEGRERRRAAGMNDHLGKPVGPCQMLVKLQEWIAGSRNPVPD